MKSRRHKNDSNPFSLFSFQDIITGISGIMIFVLLILSLELTISEEQKNAKEESRKTLFAQNPMEVFVAGKLEIANSHTSMTKEELLDLYLQEGSGYFQNSEGKIVSGTATGALYANPAYGLNVNSGYPAAHSVGNGAQTSDQSGSSDSDQNSADAAPMGQSPQMPHREPDPLQKAFQWLAANQKANGSWTNEQQHAITGLVAMAYLSHRKKSGSPEFDETLEKAIQFLIEDENCNPESEQFAYQNGIKTLALTEAVRVMGTDEDIEEAIKQSVQFIIEGQQKGGGFRQDYKTSTLSPTQDLSISAWNLLALYAVDKLYSIDEANKGVEKAKKWLTAMSKKQFTATTKGHRASNEARDTQKESMRAVGTWLTLILNRENLENVEDDLEAIVTENLPNLKWNTENEFPLFGWLFATKCMLAVGDENGENWSKELKELLLANQTKTGFWSPLKSSYGNEQIYTTAYCAQMLSLVYDYSKANFAPPTQPSSMTASNNEQSGSGTSQAGNGNSQSGQNPQSGNGNLAVNSAGSNNIMAANNPQRSKQAASTNQHPNGRSTPQEEFDNLISLNKHKAQEIKKRLNVFRRSIKSDSEVRKTLEGIDLRDQNKAIVQSLNQKYFLEAQLNKMSKDPYIHDNELLKDRYIQLNKAVTKLMKKIHLYETHNSKELTFNPVNIFVSSKELDIQLSDGQNLRFSSSPDGLKGFQTWLQSKDPSKDVLMMNIKPSGVGIYRKIEDFIEILNFKNSTTPVDENMGAKL